MMYEALWREPDGTWNITPRCRSDTEAYHLAYNAFKQKWKDENLFVPVLTNGEYIDGLRCVDLGGVEHIKINRVEVPIDREPFVMRPIPQQECMALDCYDTQTMEIFMKSAPLLVSKVCNAHTQWGKQAIVRIVRAIRE